MTPAEAGQRLDKFLAARSGLSRGSCRRAIESGGVWLKDRRVRRLSATVEVGQRFELTLDPRPTAETASLQRLYEDAEVVAIDKPAGVPSQGTRSSDSADALALASQLVGRQLLSVHRLDVGTSGVLLLAKTRAAASHLAEQFRKGTVEKIYLALVWGPLSSSAGTVRAPLGPGRRPGLRQVRLQGGEPAETDYLQLRAHGELRLIEARPRTGRTHQIRVHLSHLGAPLVGDSSYRGLRVVSLPSGALFRAERPLLHAWQLRCRHPNTGADLELSAPPPPDFARLLAELEVTELRPGRKPD